MLLFFCFFLLHPSLRLSATLSTDFPIFCVISTPLLSSPLSLLSSPSPLLPYPTLSYPFASPLYSALMQGRTRYRSFNWAAEQSDYVPEGGEFSGLCNSFNTVPFPSTYDTFSYRFLFPSVFVGAVEKTISLALILPSISVLFLLHHTGKNKGRARTSAHRVWLELGRGCGRGIYIHIHIHTNIHSYFKYTYLLIILYTQKHSYRHSPALLNAWFYLFIFLPSPRSFCLHTSSFSFRLLSILM